MSKTKFIIATSSSEGGWCTDRGSTLSLINSHVASHKARQGVNRLWEQKAHHASVGNRPKKIGSTCLTSNAPALSCDASVSTKPSRSTGTARTWSFEEMNDSFSHQDIGTGHIDPELSLSLPTRLSSRGHEMNGNNGSGAAEFHDIIDLHKPSLSEVMHFFPPNRPSRDLFVSKAQFMDAKIKFEEFGHNTFARLPMQASREGNTRYDCYNLQQIPTGLDPFLRLAIDVSNREKNLLHYCKCIAM